MISWFLISVISACSAVVRSEPEKAATVLTYRSACTCLKMERNLRKAMSPLEKSMVSSGPVGAGAPSDVSPSLQLARKEGIATAALPAAATRRKSRLFPEENNFPAGGGETVAGDFMRTPW